MRVRNHLGTLAFTIALLLLACQFAWAQGAAVRSWSGVTVVDAQMWRYTDVTVTWIDGGRALELRRVDGATKVYEPDDILHIYDADGREITAEVASGRSASRPGPVSDADQGTSPGGGGEVGGSAAAMQTTLGEMVAPDLFRLAFDAGIGHALTEGDWYYNLDNGLNYQGGVRIGLSRHRYLHLVVRHQDLGHQNFAVYDAVNDSYSSLPVDFDVNEYQLLVGKYSKLTTDKVVENAGYFEFGFSVMDHRASTNYYGGNSGSVVKAGLALQGGLWVMLAPNAAFDFSVSASYKPGFGDSETAGLILGAHAGLAVFH